MTKKTSTPTYPPRMNGMPAWKRITTPTATAAQTFDIKSVGLTAGQPQLSPGSSTRLGHTGNNSLVHWLTNHNERPRLNGRGTDLQVRFWNLERTGYCRRLLKEFGVRACEGVIVMPHAHEVERMR